MSGGFSASPRTLCTDDGRIRPEQGGRPRLSARVALQPVMDLSDRRVLAYEAQCRPAGADALCALDSGLAATTLTHGVPVLVPLPAALLADDEFDAGAHALSANARPADVVFVLPTTSSGAMPAATRRRVADLHARGYRIALDGVRILELSWLDVAELRPSFLILERLQDDIGDHHSDSPLAAALAGVLAFAGRLSCRVVARGIDTDERTKGLVRVGVFYGLGDHLNPPVVVDPTIAAEGDEVVDAAWFRSLAVRGLPEGCEAENGTSKGRAASAERVHFVAEAPQAAEGPADHESFARLVAESASRLFLATSSEEVTRLLAEVVSKVVRFDRLAIFEADWSRFVLSPRVVIGDEIASLVDIEHPLGTGITGWAFLRGEPYLCPQAADHPEAAPIPGEPDRAESMMVVPLISHGRRIGVLDIWADGVDQYSEEDVARCGLLGQCAADAWRNTTVVGELEQRVVTDTGTGLLNKRWWDELAPREAAQARRSGGSIAILLADLDDFKLVNDRFGHLTGDLVLRQFASALTSSIRTGDAAIRWGGDEFVAILRDCKVEGAMAVAEDILIGVRAVTGALASGITASVGVALFPEHGGTLDEVVAAADAAMYEAKAAGGDQVRVHARRPAGDDPADRTLAELAGIEALAVASQASEPARQGRRTMGGDLEEQHRQLVEAQRMAMIGSFEIDLASGDLQCSAEWRRLLGIPLDERLTSAAAIERIHPDDLPDFVRAMSLWMQSGARIFEKRVRVLRDDGLRQMDMRARVRTLEDGRRIMAGTIQDVTSYLEAGASRSHAEDEFALAFEQAAIGMLTSSLDRTITRVNTALCELVGRTPADLIGATSSIFLHPDDLAGGLVSLTEQLMTTGHSRVEADRRYLRTDGRTVHVHCHATLVKDDDGSPNYVFVQIEDVTARKQQEQEIRRLALEDPLTGLPNRQLLQDRLARALARSRQSGTALAVILLGLDHFKLVNDSRGPYAGDLLLMQAARRMADGMRAADTVARLSGDVFVVVCENVGTIDQAVAWSDRLAGLLAEPFPLEDEEVYLTASCGVVLAGGDESPEDLLRDAESAMHAAKERGRGRSEVFDESIRARATGRFDLEAALRHAVERGEIFAVFQPIVSLPDDTIIGVEALARWRHPVRGMVSPAEFIPIAEEIGAIRALGESVLESAAAQLSEWHRDIPAWSDLFVAVNLSPRQLGAADLLPRCLSTLARYGLGPDSLRLEITESTLMDDPTLSASILESIHEAGIHVAMDDFGTGFSSLSRLKRLPLSTLKIDRSFVDGLGTDASDTSIVRAIVSLGHSLNLELCAEGVELPLQRNELVKLGCESAQGYFYSPPLPAEELVRALGPKRLHTV